MALGIVPARAYDSLERFAEAYASREAKFLVLEFA